LGSIIIIFNSLGENLYSIEIINQFIHTDFQLAVCHATSKCGILTRSQTTIFQLTSFQTAIGNSNFLLLNSLLDNTSFRYTASLFGFGTSIQTTPSPGIGACILIDFACKARARSFFRFSIFCNLTHCFGLSLYCITVGHT